MAKHLERIFHAFGHGSTRLFIIDTIAKNGNSINSEDLIEKVMATTSLQRQSVRKQLSRMMKKGEILRNGNNLSLQTPTEVIPHENPIESWTIVGIPISLVFLSISLIFPSIGMSQNNLTFQLSSVAFTAYAVAVKLREIVTYLRKIRA